jgi:vitamin B12 transporter
MRRYLWMLPLGLAPMHADATESALLEQVVVTAARTPQATDEVVLPIIVITGEEIRQRQVTDLGELLATVPGIDIGRNGGAGQGASLFIRGTESNHALILIDGVRINPGTIGGANFQHIDPNQVERIEILRGPRAALYGDQAMGGVINIITRRTREGTAANASARYGSDATWGIDANLGLARSDWTFDIAVGREDTDGYAFRRGSTETPGYSNTSVNLGLVHRDGGSSTSIRLWDVSADTEYLDFFLNPVSQSSSNSAIQIERRDQIGEGWTSNFRLSRSGDEIRQDQSVDFVRSSRLAVDWLSRIDLGRGMVAGLGLNIEREDANALSFGSGFDETREDHAIYGDLIGGEGPNDWMVALRYSAYDAFGEQLTWNGEYAYEFSDRTRVFAAAGTAFRAPDATDRFGFGGDPDLDPEQSTTIEIGFEQELSEGQSLRTSLYRTDIKDLIEYDLGSSMLMNTERARIQGLELVHILERPDWHLRSAIVLQQPENLNTGDDLARRSSQSLDISLGRSFGDWSLNADIQYVGSRKDSAFSTIRVDGYTLLDLAASWRMEEQWTLRVRAENLADAEYQTADGYSGRGRSLFASLDYQWR